MVQLGWLFLPIFDKIIRPSLRLTFEVLKSMSRAKGGNIQKRLLDAGNNSIDNKNNIEPSSLLKDLWLTLANYEIKAILKADKFMKIRGALLKGTTGKSISQKGMLFRFLGTLMIVGLPLIKNVLTRHDRTDNLKQKVERYYENI